MTATLDAIVIGGGIVGAACAWRLSQAGLSVAILEKDDPGQAASSAALGILSFHKNPHYPAAMQQLCTRSQKYYPAIIDELAEVTGARVNYHADGQIHLAIHEEDRAELEALIEKNQKAEVALEPLTAEESVELEAAINPAIVGGAYFPEDAWVDNRGLTQAILRAAEETGVQIIHDEALRVRLRRGRIREIEGARQKYAADAYVLAAGAWSGRIQGLPPLAVEPVRGQALAVAGHPVSRVVASTRALLAPKGIGETLIGTTFENVGFDASNSIPGMMHILESAFEISPSLTSFQFQEAWAGLRPGTPDDLPVLGPFAEISNLIAATGHYRDGILLAPLTASLVSSLVLDEPIEMDLTPFSPDRASLQK